ncbi:hypothetical protein [Streptacidiphilus anmyonensis]|uniref:hypothetical protein n=1 Tax=Streptacidiphilus anmyonensis TaxID=405782 RepID=UPI00128E67DB|nr:hypothetical protein [Streptacidiphilus anmyonensis]
MGLSHEISMRCRHCEIIYTGDAVTVIRLRWGLRSYRRRFRVDGRWPIRPVQAVRHRYWRRLRVHSFQVWSMRPIEVTAGSGRGRSATPPTLTFTALRPPGRSVTVPVTVKMLAQHGDLIGRINRAIAERAPR